MVRTTNTTNDAAAARRRRPETRRCKAAKSHRPSRYTTSSPSSTVPHGTAFDADRDRHQDHQDTGTSTAGERDRRTLRRNDPPRTARPNPDHQSMTRRIRAACVRAPLQQQPIAPRSRPGRSPTAPPPRHPNCGRQHPTTRLARRTDPRVPARRIGCAEFLASTASDQILQRDRPFGHSVAEVGASIQCVRHASRSTM